MHHNYGYPQHFTFWHSWPPTLHKLNTVWKWNTQATHLYDNIGFVSLIYLGWELMCGCILLYCVYKAIPILSAYFLWHPYIPHSRHYIACHHISPWSYPHGSRRSCATLLAAGTGYVESVSSEWRKAISHNHSVAINTSLHAKVQARNIPKLWYSYHEEVCGEPGKPEDHLHNNST